MKKASARPPEGRHAQFKVWILGSRGFRVESFSVLNCRFRVWGLELGGLTVVFAKQDSGGVPDLEFRLRVRGLGF